MWNLLPIYLADGQSVSVVHAWSYDGPGEYPVQIMSSYAGFPIDLFFLDAIVKQKNKPGPNLHRAMGVE